MKEYACHKHLSEQLDYRDMLRGERLYVTKQNITPAREESLRQPEFGVVVFGLV